MSSEINTNELNRIQDDGRMPAESVEIEDEKILEEVEEGKRSTEELPQLIPPMRIIDEVQHNDIYKLIIGPCSAEGFNVNQKLLDLLKDKKIKPIELASVLDNTMQDIIKYVNQNDAYPIMFSDEGKIDVEETVQKAQRTNRKVSRYVTSLAEDSGKKIEDLRARETIFGLDIAMNRSKEEYDWIDKLFQPRVQEYKDDFQKFMQENSGNFDTKKTKSGKDVITTNYSEELTVALNMMSRLDELVGVTRGTFDTRKENVLDMLRIYNYLSNPNLLSQIPKDKREEFERRFQKAKDLIAEKCKHLSGRDISDPKKFEEVIEWSGKSKEEVEKIEDCELYKDVIRDLKDVQIDDVVINSEKLKTTAHLDSFLSICYATDFAIEDIKSRNGIIVHSSRETNRKSLRIVEGLYPEYTEEARERVRYDEYAQVRLNVLRELEAKKIFEEMDEPSVYAVEDATMTVKEYNGIRVALAVLKSSGFTEEIKREAVDIIKKRFPNTEITEELKDKIVADEDAYELGYIGDMIQQEAVYETFMGKNPQEIVSGNDLAYSGMSLLDGRTKSKMLKEIMDASKEGKPVELSVLNSKEYDDLLSEQMKKYDEKIFSTKKFEYLTKELTKYAREIDGDDKNNKSDGEIDESKEEKEILFVSELIATAKALQTKTIVPLELMVKEYLIDYLPDAFDKKGELNIAALDDLFELYLLKKGYSEEEIPGKIQELDDKIKAGVNEELNKESTSTDIIKVSKDLESKLGLRLVYEKRLEQIEDTARFVNYILSKKDTLSEEEQKKFEGYATTIHSKNDKMHKNAMDAATRSRVDFVFEHDGYDKEKVKPKYAYMEKEARKVIASERIAEATERFKQVRMIGLFQKDEIQGILGTYMGILNDYKNEEIAVNDYAEMMNGLAELMKKIDPRLVDKDGRIDEDKVLDKYNEIFETDYDDTEKLSSHEETELLMRYAKKLSEEFGTSEKKYRSIIYDEELYLKNKIHEKIREDVHMDIERTSILISDVWAIVAEDAQGQLDESDKDEYILRLALIEGLYGEKTLSKKGLSYEANLTQELEKKTLGIARMKLAEFFPEAFREDDTFDRTRLMIELQEYFDTNNPAIADKLDNGITIFKALEEYSEEQFGKAIGPRLNSKTPEQLLDEANAILKGEEKEKTYEDNVLVAAMTVKMLDELGKPEMGDRLLKKLTKDMSEAEKDKFVQDCNTRDVDEKTTNAMRRVVGLINIERYNNQLQKDDAGESKVPMNADNIADYLQIAVGALVSCNELPDTEINLSAQKEITDFIKKLAPKTVNSKGKVDYKKLMNVVNDLRAQQPDKNGNYEECKTKEEFISSSVRKSNVRLGIELYRGRIDSRFTNKYYVPVEAKKDDISRPISEAEMDRVVEARGEEIVVDPEATRAPVEEKKKNEDVVISGEEFDSKFAESAVELGGEEPKKVVEPAPEVTEVATPKVNQQVIAPSQGVHAENMQVADDTWRANFPVEQKQRGFIGNLFDKIKTSIKNGIKTVKDKIFGASENNTTTTGTTDTTTTTSSSGGVDKTEQDKVAGLTGYGKFELKFNNQGNTVSTEDKGKDPKSGGEPEHDEEVL